MEFSGEFWLLCVVFVSVESCQLSGKSGPFPYVVRIQDGSGATVGHGSIVNKDTVLSTCTLYLDVPGKLSSKKYVIIGYDFKGQCNQKRLAKAITMHETCSKASSLEFPFDNDFALWTVQPFEVDQKFPPFLWGPPSPPNLAKIKTLINSLTRAPKKLKTGLFAKQDSGSELQTGAEVESVSWTGCKTDILMKVDSQVIGIYVWSNLFDEVIRRDDRGNFTFFCGWDKNIAWNPPKDPKVQPEADWYTGAAVSIEAKSGDVKSRVAIGMLGRAVSVNVTGQKNFRIISGFHQGLYELMKKSGITPFSKPKLKPKTKKPATARHLKRDPLNIPKNSQTYRQPHYSLSLGILILRLLDG